MMATEKKLPFVDKEYNFQMALYSMLLKLLFSKVVLVKICGYEGSQVMEVCSGLCCHIAADAQVSQIRSKAWGWFGFCLVLFWFWFVGWFVGWLGVFLHVRVC